MVAFPPISQDAAPTAAPDVSAGVHVALERFYSQEAANVYRTVCGIVLDRTAALDLTEETFAWALEDWDRFGPSEHRVQLLEIATTLAIAHEEERRHRDPSPPVRVGTDSGSDASPDEDVVSWLLRPLTADQRALLVLHLYQRVPADGVANLLGVAVGTVASRVSMAMQVLRQRALIWETAVPAGRRGMASTDYYGNDADLNAQIIEALIDGLDGIAVSLPTLAEALERTWHRSHSHRKGRRFSRALVVGVALVLLGAAVVAAVRLAHVGNDHPKQAYNPPPTAAPPAEPSTAPSAPGTPAPTDAPPAPSAAPAPATPPAARPASTSGGVPPTSSAPPPPAPSNQTAASAPTTSTTSRSPSAPQSPPPRSGLPTCGLLGLGCP